MRGDESEAVSASFTKKPGRICRRVRCCQQLATGNKNVKLDCFILGAYAAIAGGFPYGGAIALWTISVPVQPQEFRIGIQSTPQRTGFLALIGC
jgi:hypothetical protein